MLVDGKIVFNFQLILGKTGESQPVSLTAIPQIRTDGQIALQNMQYLEGKELPSELTAALNAQVSDILSLRNFKKKGMSLRIWQIDVTNGKLTLQADTELEQFPSF